MKKEEKKFYEDGFGWVNNYGWGEKKYKTQNTPALVRKNVGVETFRRIIMPLFRKYYQH